MTNETLSSKIHADLGDGGLIFTSDVKDFIQKLKEEIEAMPIPNKKNRLWQGVTGWRATKRAIPKIIDKLAGDALIHGLHRNVKDTPDGQPLRGAGSSGTHSPQENLRGRYQKQEVKVLKVLKDSVDALVGEGCGKEINWIIE